MAKTWMQTMKEKLIGANAPGTAAGSVVAGRTAEEVEKPINGNHFSYGTGQDISRIAREAAADRAMAENILRHAYDPHHKAIRVVSIDEF